MVESKAMTLMPDERAQKLFWDDVEATTRRAVLVLEAWVEEHLSDPGMAAEHKKELAVWRCHIVERRTREFCVPNIFKRPRLPRATCS